MFSTYWFSTRRLATMFIFKRAKLYLKGWSGGLRHVAVPNFVKIGPSVAAILRFFVFLKMAAVRHLGFVWGIFELPTENTRWSLSLCYDRCSSFDNMNVSIFGTFGWKRPTHAPKLGFCGYLTPWMGCSVNKSQKAHHFVSKFPSFESSSVKIQRAVWPVGESKGYK